MQADYMNIPTASNYLDAILQRSLDNDRSLRYDANIAQALGVSRTTMSGYRKGNCMSVLVAVKMAELLDMTPMETISATMYHQAKTEEEKDFWLTRYQKWTTQNRSEAT